MGHPRFYLFDTGVTNALNHQLRARPIPCWRVRVFEQSIILEVVRTLDYLGSEARLFYWRTNTGAEVDLVIEKHGRLVLAVEIKAGRRIAGADLSGLRSFGQAHPDVPRMVVAQAPEKHLLGDVPVVPYREFLGRLEALVEPARD